MPISLCAFFMFIDLTCCNLSFILHQRKQHYNTCIPFSISFFNPSPLLSFSGSAGWAWGAWPPRIKGGTGACLTTRFTEIITYRKIIGFPVWWIVWSSPQGPPGTPGYPGSMGPPGLPVSFFLPHYKRAKELKRSWQLSLTWKLTAIYCAFVFVRDWRVNAEPREALVRKGNW